MSKQFSFVLHSCSHDDYEAIKQWDCQYLIVGKWSSEGAIQGCACFLRPRTITGLKRLNPRVEWKEEYNVSEFVMRASEDHFVKGTAPPTHAEREAAQAQKEVNQSAKWKDLITLSEQGNLLAIKEKYPMEYFMRFSSINRIYNNKRKFSD